jgi:hypothetical protein
MSHLVAVTNKELSTVLLGGLRHIVKAWNSDKLYVDIAMPANVAKQLLQYKHPHPMKPQHCTYNLNPIKYGQDNQATAPIDISPKLNEAKKNAPNKLLEAFYTMHALSVPPSSWH